MVKLDASSQAALKQASVSPVVLLEDVPYLRQKHVDGCGPTNLAMVLSYHLGIPVSEKELYQFVPFKGKGIEALELLLAFSRLKNNRGIGDVVIKYYAPPVSLYFRIAIPERSAQGVPAANIGTAGDAIIPKTLEANEHYFRDVLERPRRYFKTHIRDRQKLAMICLELLQSGVSFQPQQASLDDVLGSLNQGLPVMLADGRHWWVIVGYGTIPKESKQFDELAFIVHNSNFSATGGAFQPNTTLVTRLKEQSYCDTLVVAKK